MDVTGAPRLKIKMDLGGGEFRANCESGSGTAAPTLAHRVAEPNASPQSIAVLAQTLELNSGGIESAGTGAAAHLAHTQLGHNPIHDVDWLH